MSGNEAAISGDTRSDVKRPLSSLDVGTVTVVLFLVVEIEAGDIGVVVSAEGEVSMAMISDMVGIVEVMRKGGCWGVGQVPRALWFGGVAILREYNIIERQGKVLPCVRFRRCLS